MMSYYILIMWLEEFSCFFVCECSESGSQQLNYLLIFFFFFISVSQISHQNFQIMVKRLNNPETLDTEINVNALYFPPLRCVCMYVCTPPFMCMWWVGWMYVLSCHLVAPTGFAKATVWVTLRQFAPHLLFFFSFAKRHFFTGSVSTYGLTPSCCCFHHYCWFIFYFYLFFLVFWLYLTALNCCSPGCIFIFEV